MVAPASVLWGQVCFVGCFGFVGAALVDRGWVGLPGSDYEEAVGGRFFGSWGGGFFGLAGPICDLGLVEVYCFAGGSRLVSPVSRNGPSLS